MPRMLTKRPSPVSVEMDTPGIRPRASAALKSGYFSMVSADCTAIRLGASFCSRRAVTSIRGAVTTTLCTVSAAVSAAGASAAEAMVATRAASRSLSP